MAWVLGLILRERWSITNLLLIKGILMVNSVMHLVCAREKGLQLISLRQTIISNFLPIKVRFLLNSIIEPICALEIVFRFISDRPLNFKLAADQGNAVAQCIYAACLQNEKGVSIDVTTAAHHFKLSADQRDPDAQYQDEFT
jgi:hypothetical protein